MSTAPEEFIAIFLFVFKKWCITILTSPTTKGCTE